MTSSIDELYSMMLDKAREQARTGKKEELGKMFVKVLELGPSRPGNIRRNRLREVRLKRLTEDERKLKDLEKQLLKVKEIRSDFEKERREAEVHIAKLRAQKHGNRGEQTTIDSEIDESRTSVTKLSEKLKETSLAVKKLEDEKNKLREILDEEEEESERQEQSLCSYLQESVNDEQYKQLLNEWREMRDRAVRKLTNWQFKFDVFNEENITALWDCLKSRSQIMIGDYRAVAYFLLLSPYFEHLKDEIHRIEDIILGPYDTTKKRSFSDFRRKTDGWLGRGAYGSVCSFQHKITGETIAIKEIDVPQSVTTKEYEELMVEVEMARELSQYEHPNIVQYFFEHKDTVKLYIGMEYMAGGSLTKKIDGEALLEDKLRNYTHQIISGVKFLHDKHIAHRDIKSDNILLGLNDRIKLVDFGISKKLETHLLTHGARTAGKGTCQYMSPEAVQGEDSEKKGYGIKADIWSVGCVVLEMATGKRPWSEATEPMAVMFSIGSGKAPPVADNVPDDVKDFLANTFNVKPVDRSSARDLLKHKLVADLEERYLKNMETLVAIEERDDSDDDSYDTSADDLETAEAFPGRFYPSFNPTPDEGETASSSSDYMQLPKRHRSGSDTSDVIAKKKKVSESP